MGDRVVEQGRVVTAAGGSAGIDMALLLAARIAGEAAAETIQLTLEYDPQPPYDAGSPRKARASTRAAVRDHLHARARAVVRRRSARAG